MIRVSDCERWRKYQYYGVYFSICLVFGFWIWGAYWEIYKFLPITLIIILSRHSSLKNNFSFLGYLSSDCLTVESCGEYRVLAEFCLLFFVFILLNYYSFLILLYSTYINAINQLLHYDNCPEKLLMHGNVWDHIWWVFEKPDLVECVPTYGREVGTR